MELNTAKAANKYRNERKFVIYDLTFEEIEAIIKFHPEYFKEIYYPRYINNIYFDSINLGSYFANLAGAQHRVKTRIRWYGDLFGLVRQPSLELKIKNGLMIKKEIFGLPGFQLDRSFNFAAPSNIFNNSQIPEEIKIRLLHLNPIFINRYKRKYFLSFDGKYRITLDVDIDYYRLDKANNAFLCHSREMHAKILELKYRPCDEETVKNITNYFPFRLERNSKYVNGIERLYVI